MGKVINVVNSETGELIASISGDDVIIKNGYGIIEKDEEEAAFCDENGKIIIKK